MNLLIVDDHLTNLKLLRAQLESEGHAVFEAHDGVDALALLERQRVDAVISDILMSRMDGYRLCHEIRKHARLRDLPIIIYSSTYTSPEDEKLALEMGADKYLKKPASVATLVAALHEVAAQPHAAPRPDALWEVEVLKNFNERLVSKLKEKNTELQAQTEALRASEERYRLLFERAPDVIFALAPMGAIASLNHAFETITGWPPAQWLGRPFQELIHPDDQTRAGELFQLLLGRERVPTFELRMRTVAGGFRDVEFTGFSSELSGGRIEVQGIGRDITERKRADEALAYKQSLLSALMDNVPDQVYFKDTNSRFIIISKAQAERFGLSDPAQAVGKTDFDFFNEDHARPAFEDEQRIMKTGRPLVDLEEKETWPDGRTAWVSTTKVPLRDRQGRIIGTFGISRDITERKRAEEEVQDSEEKYRTLVEYAAETILVAQDGMLKFVNRKASELTGYSEQELLSSPFLEFIHPDDRQMVGERYLRRIKGDGSIPRYAFRLIGNDGSIKWVEIDAVLVTWQGKPATLNFLSDITERKKTEKKLEETLSGLRNALGGIIQVLSVTIEKRDPYTAGHQTRVADLTRAIAQEMGLPPERVEGLRLAGTIHDIGKVSIPAEILSKPGRLTKLEFDMIKSHPQVGHDILRDVDFTWPLAEMVLQHHERMDGSGYPRGLKGEDILLEARILAVADVVEAMASHRPYRSTLGIAAALEEIEKNRGILYDSDVVSACLRLFREKGFNFK
jgi:PAS domain S-box-containing protein